MFIGKCIILNCIIKGKLRCILVGLYLIIFNRYMIYELFMEFFFDSILIVYFIS